MAKITSQADLNVGVELIIDEPNREIELLAAGNLTAKDGVASQALYSKFVSLWNTAAYQDSPFPFNAVDVLSGQFQIGTDGRFFNDWKFKNQASIDMVRDGGFEAFNASGDKLYERSCFRGLGIINSGAQPYYILDAGDAPIDFPFDDQFNAMVQVFGDSNNGNFDKRTSAKAFVREQGYIYADSVLADTGRTETGPYITDFLVSNAVDDNIVALDAVVTTDPLYTGTTIEYFGSDQNKSIDGVNYPYRVIVTAAAGATLQQIYTKVQYELRQNSDIDSGAGSVTGKTADLLMDFNGSTLVTRQGVFIEGVSSDELGDIIQTDQNSVARTYKFVAGGNLTFTSNLVGVGSTFRLMYATPPGGGDDYGESGAVTVNDASDTPITGVITAGSIAFDFDYDANTQAGFTAGTDRDVVLIGVKPGSAKYTVFFGTITRAKGLTLSLVANDDKAYAA